MKRNTTTAILIFVGLLLLIGLLTKLSAGNMNSSRGSSASWSGGGETVALINVEGVISGDSGSASPFGGAAGVSSVQLCKQLYEIRDDDSIKAIVLRVNSPGGSAAASDEIYHAIKAVHDKGKPIVVSMGDVAASGGYYISSAADYIYANPATLTGSIGVIFELINWDEAAGKLGIKSETLHAGQFKDIGSPWRDMRPDERDALTRMLTQVHDQFIHAVDEGRKTLDEAGVRKLATGMIYNGEDAAKNGLVDGLGGLEEAKIKARELAKLPKDALVEEYGGGSFWDSFFSSRSQPGLDPRAMEGLSSALAASRLLGESRAGTLSTLAQGLYLNSTLRDLVIH